MIWLYDIWYDDIYDMMWYDTTWYDIWYDIYLLTAIKFPAGGNGL